MSFENDLLQETHDRLQRDCKTRIKDLRVLLDHIENDIDRGFSLNELGEIQGRGDILDCRIASLATIRNLLSLIDDEKELERRKINDSGR